MLRRNVLLLALVAIMATWALTGAPTSAANSNVPNGVFVRNSEGLVWLVLDGQRIKIPVWSASDEEIAALPVPDRWAVLNDAGVIVAGDRPSWLDNQPIAAAPPEPQPQEPQPQLAPAPPPPPPPPTAMPQPAPAAQPVVIRGRGRTATERITPPSGLTAVTFAHEGKSNFIVRVVRSDRDLLVNTVGAYRGQRLIVGTEPLVLDIDADGAWTADLAPVTFGGQAAFSGKGDAVSSAFDPPAAGAWTLTHEGKSNFIVKLHCAGGSDLVENTIGAMNGSAVVTFKRGPCLWEVEADGAWKLAPR